MLLNSKKIHSYVNRTFSGKLLKYNKNIIKKSNYLYIDYFYWLYKDLYQFKIIGTCFKKKKKFIFSLLSFYIFYNIKNIKINQVYFINSPFLFFIKKNIIKNKKNIKNIFIL